MWYGMLNTKSNEKKPIDLLLPVFLMGIILVSSGCVTILHFADAKKKSSTGDTGGGGTTKGGGTETGGGTPSGGTPSGGTPSGTEDGTPSGGTPSGTEDGTPSGGTPGTTPAQQQPNIKVGQINQQNCAGIQSVFECNLNVNNIHKTTIREGGSTVVVGQPATTASGATPVILYIQGVGYVQVTGIQAAGSGQATISYVVLVPAK